MALIRHLLKYPLANRPGQYLLRKQVKWCHWLMGVGAGTSVWDSGEAAVAKKLLREKRSGLVILDVGANHGQFAQMVTQSLGDRLQAIHCFEPGAATFKILVQNAPKRDGIILNQVGLSNRCGQAELFYDRETSGLASLSQRDLTFRNRTFDLHETVNLTTVDTYCAGKNLHRVDWLKIDVEGHELDVLKGATGLFKSDAIGLVTFEFGGCNIDTRTFLRDYYNFFREWGMQIYRITPGGYFHPIRYRETEEQFNTINFAAFRTASSGRVQS